MSQIFENYSCRYWRTGFVHEQWEKHCCWGSIEIILHILNGDYKPLQGSHIKQPGFNSERYPAGAFFFSWLKWIQTNVRWIHHISGFPWNIWWICITDPYAYPPSLAFEKIGIFGWKLKMMGNFAAGSDLWIDPPFFRGGKNHFRVSQLLVLGGVNINM